LLHFFPPPAAATAAAVAPAISYAAALTPPRPALRAINDSRATIDDELAKVVLYSSPQRLAAGRRIPSPRRAPDHPNHRAFLPSSHGDGRSIRSHGDGSRRSSQGGGSSSSSSNVTSEDEYGIHSRGDSAGYRADKEYSVSNSTNEDRSRIQYVALSPTSTQASPAAELGRGADSTVRAAGGVSGTVSTGFGRGDSERHKAGEVPAGANHLHSASSFPGRTNIGGSHVPGLLSGRLTRTLSNHENVEVVVMYDLAHNSIEHDSDISSLHNQSSSYDKANSSASRSDSAANAASAATESSPPLAAHQSRRSTAKASSGHATPGGAVDSGDRRRYRTVVPSRVFLDLRASSTDNNIDMMFPEPYDSFLSNPSGTAASQRRPHNKWAVREPGSHRSAPT
jgi:hypothetical protein